MKAVVAWDNLGPRSRRRRSPRRRGRQLDDDRREGVPGRPGRSQRPCRSPSRAWACRPTTGCRRRPTRRCRNRWAKSKESLAYSQAGVDSGEIIIRGGSHLDFSFIPNQAFGASLRGPDMIAWYTSAWFDKYLGTSARRTSGCSATAGAKNHSRPKSIPTTTATRSPSTTSRAWTSTSPTARSGTARTCAKAAPAWSATTASEALLLRGDRPREKCTRLVRARRGPRTTSSRLRPGRRPGAFARPPLDAPPRHATVVVFDG